MPGDPTLVIEQSDGTVRDELTGPRATKRESLIESWRGTIVVDRADWTDVLPDIDQINDVLRIERADGSTLFEGRFGTDNRDGQNVVVTVASYERDAQDAEPTGGRLVFSNVNDSAVFNDAINAVSSLSLGTVETGATSVSFTFANASRAKQARDAAEPDGQDVRYRTDAPTVDFLDRLGSDKPNTTISSDNQTIVESLSVEENSRDPVTHIRGLGAQRGPDQVSVEATIASYSAGDRQVWRKYVNKDVVNEDRLQAIVDRLATEFDSERRRIRVSADLVNVDDLGIGDSPTVSLPQHDIDRTLRIVEWTETVSSSPATYSATLTNRTAERGGSRKRRDDLLRFNEGDQGFIDRDTDAYGWQPVTSSVNATRPYPFPSDVLTEIKAEVKVNSIPYRAYSSGGAVNDPSTFSKIQDQDLASNARISSGNSFSFDAKVPDTQAASPFNEVFNDYVLECIVGLDTLDPNDVTSVAPATFDLEIEAPTSGGFTQYRNEVDTDDLTGSAEIPFVSSVPVGGDEVTATVTNTQSSDIVLDNITGIDMWKYEHQHPVQPGLKTFSNKTASNVDLIVNGNTVSSNIGSGTFDATVDISGELTAGSNTIEATSDSLGLLNLLVETQLFRRGRSSP